ncbi:GyrI-like domain-containing protein [Neisseriaceae bacterium B1]
MSLSYEITTLPYFRVAGFAVRSNPAQQAQDLAQLWQSFHLSGSLKDELHAFSTTTYCVYHDYADDDSFTILLGKLVPTDIKLPEHLSNAWIAPQNYAVFSLPEKNFQAVLPVWQTIQQMSETDLARRKHVDFETYPAFGEAKLYIGLTGKIEMEENIIEESET